MTFRLFTDILRFFSIIVSLLSCSNTKVDDSVNFKTLNDSLTIESRNLAYKNDSLYMALESKMRDVKTSQLATYWFPRATQFQFESHEIYEYLEKYTSNLTSDSISNNGDSLYLKLNFYKERISRIDPEIHQTINNKADIITYYFDSLQHTEPKNIEPRFSRKSKEEIFFILELTRKNIRTVENSVLLFCNLKVDKLK